MRTPVHRRDAGWRVRAAVLVGGDLLAAALAYPAAFLLRVLVPLPLTRGYLPALRFVEVNHHWLAMLAAQVLALYFLGLYEAQALASPRRFVGNVVAAALLQALMLIAVYFFDDDLVFPRSIFVVFAALNAAALVGWRLSCGRLMGRHPRRRVLVVGTNAAATEVVTTIRAQEWLGMDVVGAVAGEEDARAFRLDGVPVLGGREELAALCARHEVDEVIIASEATWQDRLVEGLAHVEGGRARVYVVPSPYEILIGRREHLRLHDIPLIELRRPVTGGAGIAKRAFDVALAVVLLGATLPIMLLVAAAVGLSTPGPVLYRQTRVGRGGRAFTMLKFRTMEPEAERATGPVLAAANDPRVTALGRFLRATRLDELPQLWNVLRGDMSFVGPRPERPEFVGTFTREIDGYGERFSVRPGVTGYAQVGGEYHTSAATKLKYDLAYIYNRTLWLDLRILSETVRVMLTRRGV